jgi:hypothetical protein
MAPLYATILELCYHINYTDAELTEKRKADTSKRGKRYFERSFKMIRFERVSSLGLCSMYYFIPSKSNIKKCFYKENIYFYFLELTCFLISVDFFFSSKCYKIKNQNR